MCKCPNLASFKVLSCSLLVHMVIMLFKVKTFIVAFIACLPVLKFTLLWSIDRDSPKTSAALSA